MRAMIALLVRPRPSVLPLWILALLALVLAAPAAMASPRAGVVVESMAQQTGGSFGGSRWGSGSSSSGGSPSWGGGSSSSSGSYSSGGGYSSRRSGGDSGGLFWIVFQIVIWCFSVSPVLGFAVLGVGLAFLFFVWAFKDS